MQWIPEKEAAQILLSHPRTLRRKAKVCAWPITFTRVDGRKYQYSKSDLDKFLLSQSNKTKI